MEEYPGIEFVWFYDEKGLIHYSTIDFAEKSVNASNRKVYKNLKDAVKSDNTADPDKQIVSLKLLTEGNDRDFDYILDEENDLMLYKYLAVDKLGLTRGLLFL